MILLAVRFVLVLGQVGRDGQDCGAVFGGEEGDSEVWLVFERYVEGLDGWVCIFVYREDGAA